VDIIPIFIQVFVLLFFLIACSPFDVGFACSINLAYISDPTLFKAGIFLIWRIEGLQIIQSHLFCMCYFDLSLQTLLVFCFLNDKSMRVHAVAK
jgi:hypothetical protein